MIRSLLPIYMCRDRGLSENSQLLSEVFHLTNFRCALLPQAGYGGEGEIRTHNTLAGMPHF